MAISFLAGLSATLRAAFPIIKRGVAEGLSGNAIQRVLTIADLGTRRAPLQKLISRLRGVKQQTSRLKFLPRNAIPNVLRLPEALHKIRQNFSFTVRVRGTQADTGLALDQHVTIASDVPLSRSRLEQMAEDVVDRQRDRYKVLIESSLLLEGLRAGPAGRL